MGIETSYCGVEMFQQNPHKTDDKLLKTLIDCERPTKKSTSGDSSNESNSEDHSDEDTEHDIEPPINATDEEKVNEYTIHSSSSNHIQTDSKTNSNKIKKKKRKKRKKNKKKGKLKPTQSPSQQTSTSNYPQTAEFPAYIHPQNPPKPEQTSTNYTQNIHGFVILSDNESEEDVEIDDNATIKIHTIDQYGDPDEEDTLSQCSTQATKPIHTTSLEQAIESFEEMYPSLDTQAMVHSDGIINNHRSHSVIFHPVLPQPQMMGSKHLKSQSCSNVHNLSIPNSYSMGIYGHPQNQQSMVHNFDMYNNTSMNIVYSQEYSSPNLPQFPVRSQSVEPFTGYTVSNNVVLPPLNDADNSHRSHSSELSSVSHPSNLPQFQGISFSYSAPHTGASSQIGIITPSGSSNSSASKSNSGNSLNNITKRNSHIWTTEQITSQKEGMLQELAYLKELEKSNSNWIAPDDDLSD